MKKSRIFVCVILTLLTLLIIFRIFYNSLLNADESADDSLYVLNIVNDFIKNIGLEVTLTDHIVRKVAHFIEFFILGSSAFFTFYAYTIKLKWCCVSAFCLSVLIAVCDELLQLLSFGRSCEIKDMLIDSSGALLAVIIFGLVIHFRLRKKKLING